LKKITSYIPGKYSRTFGYITFYLFLVYGFINQVLITILHPPHRPVNVPIVSRYLGFGSPVHERLPARLVEVGISSQKRRMKTHFEGEEVRIIRVRREFADRICKSKEIILWP